MTWREAALSLQVAAEERVGFVMRERARMAREVEDAIAGAQVNMVPTET